MSIATIEIQPRVQTVEMESDTLKVHLQDGRMVSAPLSWYPRLADATDKERTDWRIFEDSDGRDIIFWEQLDELVPVVALLTGTPSRESRRSFERWQKERKTPVDMR